MRWRKWAFAFVVSSVFQVGEAEAGVAVGFVEEAHFGADVLVVVVDLELGQHLEEEQLQLLLGDALPGALAGAVAEGREDEAFVGSGRK